MKSLLIFLLSLGAMTAFLDGCITVSKPVEIGQGQDDPAKDRG
jgi:hypothetical protein